jgi:uncharacterized protein (DUF1330 family)
VLSRSLLAFLLFCVALVAVSGVLVWHLGPTLVGIALDPGKRTAPYHVLHLTQRAGADAEAQRAARTRLLTLAAEEGGSLLWQGGAVEVVEGPVRLDGSTLQVLAFASGGGVVQFFTRSDYRALAADSPGAGLSYGSVDPPGELAVVQASIVVLYRAKPDGGEATLGVPGESGWLERVPRYGGDLRWHAGISPIDRQGSWNRLLVLQFPDVASARRWLADPLSVTERALAARYIDQVVILLVQPA